MVGQAVNSVVLDASRSCNTLNTREPISHERLSSIGSRAGVSRPKGNAQVYRVLRLRTSINLFAQVAQPRKDCRYLFFTV